MLIFKPCCLGDVLLATPLLRSIASAWPRASIDWAVDRHSRAAIEGNPDLAELVDATGCVRGAIRPLGVLRLAHLLRRRSYAWVFVPDRSPLSSLLAAATGARQRVGLDSGGRGRLYTMRVPVVGIKHEAELYLDLARAAGLPTAAARPLFVVSDSDRAAARRELGGAGGRLRVALHPGGGVNPGLRLVEKRWPAERFGALATTLVDDWQAQVVVVGGQDDLPLAASVVEHSRRALVNAAGRLTLGQTAAAIQLCDLYVGNDTGATHLATAVGTPVVAVFGPTDPRRYGPVPGSGRAVAPVRSPVDRLGDARGSRAILDVSLGQVLEALGAVAAQHGLRL